MEQNDIAIRLASLREEHRDLDRSIGALHERDPADQLMLARMKRRKLRLKDEIMALENLLIPDIIA